MSALKVTSRGPRSSCLRARRTASLYEVRPPGGSGMICATSWFSVTASSASEAARGMATPMGMGVTRPIQRPERRWAGMGRVRTRRRASPAASA